MAASPARVGASPLRRKLPINGSTPMRSPPPISPCTAKSAAPGAPRWSSDPGWRTSSRGVAPSQSAALWREPVSRQLQINAAHPVLADLERALGIAGALEAEALQQDQRAEICRIDVRPHVRELECLEAVAQQGGDGFPRDA